MDVEGLVARYELPATSVSRFTVLLDALATEDAPTSVRDPRKGLAVHVADSLAGLEVPELRAAGALADLGAGAGLPGLVLATGHAMKGLALAPVTGRLVAPLLAGERPAHDLEPLPPDRFRSLLPPRPRAPPVPADTVAAGAP